MNEQLVPSRKSISNLLVPFPTILVTRNRKGTINAATMSYISAIHWDPPSIMLSVGASLKTSHNLKENPNFTICMMRNDSKSKEIANKAGTSSGKQENKFDKTDFLENQSDQIYEQYPPVIKGAVIALYGSIVKKIEYHDQILYIGEISGSRMIESLQMIDEYDKNKLWGALDEIILTHATIYEKLD
ncbi:MAG: flavin reductase family protein [Candidatus Hodarchaeales archaeon]